MVSPLETPRSSLAATKAADNIEPIVALARDGTDEQKSHAVKVLNLLAMKADLQEALAKAATKELLSLAPHENKTISNYALTALLNLADNKAAARTIVEHRGVEHISNLLSPSLIEDFGSYSSATATAAAVIASLASRGVIQELNKEMIGDFASLISMPTATLNAGAEEEIGGGPAAAIKEKAALALGSIAMSSVNSRIQQRFADYALKPLVALAQYEEERPADDESSTAIGAFDGARQQAAWALRNFVCATPSPDFAREGMAQSPIEAVVEAGAIEPLVALEHGGMGGMLTPRRMSWAAEALDLIGRSYAQDHKVNEQITFARRQFGLKTAQIHKRDKERDAGRKTGQSAEGKILELIAEMKAQGSWPPKGRFLGNP